MKKRNLFGGQVVLAPRGMLKSSALRFKRLKKRAYLGAFRLLGLHKLIRFHATDDTEQADVRGQFGNAVNIIQAPNFPGFVKSYPGSTAKTEKELSVIFVGRLHPVKNLDLLLTLLPKVKGKVVLTVVGSEEDKAYTALCKGIVQQYPENIQVRFTGEIPNHKLPPIIAEHHIFALPTKGENFGHAIFEALRAGRPVLISDQTPWRGLATTRAGWDLNLENKDAFIAALQQAIDFDQQQYDAWSFGAWQFVNDFVQHSDLKTAYHKLFS
jgi:glycosyltransferase involved in cell wall biosynthesis